LIVPISVAANAWFCDRSLAGIAGSNFAEDMNVYLL
jgi:hypothetical protein